MRLVIYTDGSAQPTNPGHAGAGAILYLEYGDGSEPEIVKLSKYVGWQTNNVAEYMALIMALEWVIEYRTQGGEPNEVEVFSDSKLMVMQMNNRWQFTNDELFHLSLRAHDLIRQLPVVHLGLIGREHNYEADALAKQGAKEKKTSLP